MVTVCECLTFDGKRDRVARFKTGNYFDHSIGGAIANFNLSFFNDVALNDEGFIYANAYASASPAQAMPDPVFRSPSEP